MLVEAVSQESLDSIARELVGAGTDLAAHCPAQDLRRGRKVAHSKSRCEQFGERCDVDNDARVVKHSERWLNLAIETEIDVALVLENRDTVPMCDL